jgi:hypothetical protein
MRCKTGTGCKAESEGREGAAGCKEPQIFLSKDDDGMPDLDSFVIKRKQLPYDLAVVKKVCLPIACFVGYLVAKPNPCIL